MIEDLINRHWEFVKDKTKDGKKYSERYSRTEHKEFFYGWINSAGYDEIKYIVEYIIENDKPPHIA